MSGLEQIFLSICEGKELETNYCNISKYEMCWKFEINDKP